MKKKIRINRLGYMTGVPKSAVCQTSSGIFYIVDAASGINVYAGRLSHPFFDRQSGDTVRIADFSDFNTKGSYFIRAGYRRSDVFEISDMPYKDIRKTVLNGIYQNRCCFDFSSSERVSDRRECHTENISSKNVSGGWHCRSTYERSTSDSCLVVADILYSLKLFGENLPDEDVSFMSDECRWGLDWLLKMQDSDGGVYSGIYAKSEAQPESGVLPEDDHSEYKLGEKDCRAALRFTAVTALASSYFSHADKEYAKQLSMAAEKCWIWVVQAKEYDRYSSKFGSLSDSGDGIYSLESEFMWALCEMYSLTGNTSFADMINSRYITSFFTGFGYDCCGGFSALCYLLTDKKRDRTIEAFIRKRITDNADRMWIAARESGYRVAVGNSDGYPFAVNFAVLSDCMEYILAYITSGEQKYLVGAADQFAYIFGKNPMDICYMTGKDESYCHSPYHKLSSALGGEQLVEGMIVSGANSNPDDEYSKWQIEKNTPPAKCYIDSEYSRSTNEPAIHYSSPVLFVSAFFDKVGFSALSGPRKPKTANAI